MYWHATRVYELNQTKWGLCKVRMRTADADGGRRTAEGQGKKDKKSKKKILKIFLKNDMKS